MPLARTPQAVQACIHFTVRPGPVIERAVGLPAAEFLMRGAWIELAMGRELRAGK